MAGVRGRAAGAIARWVIAIGTAGMVLTACVAGDRPAARPPGEHACGLPDEVVHEPRVLPLEPDGYAGEPGALARWVRLDTLEEHAAAGASRRAAEHFSLLFAQAVLDARADVDAQALVDTLMAEEVPQAACQHVLGRLPNMRKLGWGAYVVPEAVAWVRSRAVGDETAPSRVEVQLVLAVDLANDPGLFGVEDGEPMVMSTRVDVVRAGSLWLVADWQGPEATSMEAGERPSRRDFGPGWRSWVPGVG